MNTCSAVLATEKGFLLNLTFGRNRAAENPLTACLENWTTWNFVLERESNARLGFRSDRYHGQML